jgi:hypothetical protein
MRARIVAKSSAARGRFTAFPPIRLVEFLLALCGPRPGMLRLSGVEPRAHSRARFIEAHSFVLIEDDG